MKLPCYFIQKNLKDEAAYMEGVIRGYTDWFEALGISQEVVETISLKLNRVEAMKRAGEIVTKTLEKKHPLIIVPDSPEANEVGKKIIWGKS